jgi:hypothetical protein
VEIIRWIRDRGRAPETTVIAHPEQPDRTLDA